MAVIIVSDKQNQPYTEFIAGALEALEGQDVTGIAIVALCKGEAMTGYWNMSLRDKAQAETEIRYDTIDQFLLVNKERYLEGGETYEDG